MHEPYIDIEHGTNLLGDVHVAKDLLKRFVRKLTSELQKIRALRKEKSWDKFYDAIHKLHGAACYSSTPQIVSVLKNIERVIYPVITKKSTHVNLQALDDLLFDLEDSCKQTTLLCVKVFSANGTSSCI